MSRILGIDLGDKTIGMAVSDPLGILAQSIGTIRRIKQKEDFKKLEKILEEYEIVHIVLGLPLNMDDSFGPQANKVKQFAAQLKRCWDIPISFQDERLSTIETERTMSEMGWHYSEKKERVDELAAQLILQRYLDSNETRENHELD